MDFDARRVSVKVDPAKVQTARLIEVLAQAGFTNSEEAPASDRGTTEAPRPPEN